MISCFIFAQELERYHYIKLVDSVATHVSKRNIDKSEVNVFIQNNINTYKFSGYWLAGCDSIKTIGDTLIAYIHLGEKFRRFEIYFNDSFCEVYPRLCKSVIWTIKDDISAFAITRVNKKIERFFQTTGHPFFSYVYDSISITKERVKVELNIYPFLLIRFDSLVFDSPSRTQNKYLQNLLGIKEGSVYNQSRIQDITNRIESTGFLEVVSEPYVVYKFDKAFVHIDLKERKSMLISGLVGYLPDQNTKKNSLVGEASVNFKNLFGMGIFYGLKWKRFQQRSQDLNMQMNIPFMLGSPIGGTFDLNFLKQDTSFVNVNRKLKFDFLVGKNLNASFSYQYYTSVLNSIGKEYSNSLRGNNTNQYGLGLNYNTVGIRFFPTGGSAFTLEGAIGEKMLRGETDSLARFSTQFNGLFALNKILRISPTSVFAMRMEGRLLWNNKRVILINDLYRPGGINDLRGFNEKYFFSDKYIVSSVEYRKLISRESYLVTFVDFGLLRSLNIDNTLHAPIGIGVGTVFKSSLGIFKVFYSLGKSKDQDLNIQSSKIHFALTNEF